MTLNSLPCCAHPSTVLVIEDDPTFTRILKRRLAPLNCFVRSFHCPQEALDYLRKEYKSQPSTCVKNHELDSDDIHHEVVPSLHQNIYGSTRFDQISVALVDYQYKDMLHMNGLQVCDQIPHHLIRKVLITGFLEPPEAVKAFNEGRIEGYIYKKDSALDAEVKKLVLNAFHKHFLDLSAFLRKADGYYSRYKALDDPVFIQFFEKLLKRLNIVEHWLYDSVGCFVLLDAQGRDHTLLVRDKEGLRMTYECAGIEDAPPEIQQKLKTHEAMLCSPDVEGFFYPTNAQQWKQYVRPAQKLQGLHNTYFYHLAEGLLNLQRNRIVSFDSHQAKHNHL